MATTIEVKLSTFDRVKDLSHFIAYKLLNEENVNVFEWRKKYWRYNPDHTVQMALDELSTNYGVTVVDIS